MAVYAKISDHMPTNCSDCPAKCFAITNLHVEGLQDKDNGARYDITKNYFCGVNQRVIENPENTPYPPDNKRCPLFTGCEEDDE